MASCPDGNPAGLITQEAILAGDLATVLALLQPYSCRNWLDSLAVADPYIYTDSLGDTLKVACTVFDPCFVGLVGLINGAWNYGFAGNLPFAGSLVLENCFPGSLGVAVTSAGISLLNGLGSPVCDAVYLVDSSGNVLRTDSLILLQFPAFVPSQPVAVSGYFFANM